MKNLYIYKKTHEKVENLSVIGKSIGLSRDKIIENLEIDDIFIYDSLFFYTVDKKWKEISMYLMINDKCTSEIIYDLDKSEIKSEYSNYNKFRNILSENLEKNINEINEVIKNKNRNDKN